MANRTAKDAQTVKGTNPQFLVEKIIRLRVYDCKYWKEECFGLTGMLCIKGYLDSGPLVIYGSVSKYAVNWGVRSVSCLSRMLVEALYCTGRVVFR